MKDAESLANGSFLEMSMSLSWFFQPSRRVPPQPRLILGRLLGCGEATGRVLWVSMTTGITSLSVNAPATDGWGVVVSCWTPGFPDALGITSNRVSRMLIGSSKVGPGGF